MQVNVNIDVSWKKSKKLECLTNHFLLLTHTNDEEKKKVKGERYTTKPRWYHITYWSLISLYLLYVVSIRRISYSTLLDRRREGQMFQCQCLDNSQRFQGGAHLHYTVKSLPSNCSTDALAPLVSLLVLTSRPCSDSMYINIEFPVV